MGDINLTSWIVPCVYFLLFSSRKCTIDITLTEFSYIADHLTLKDCRRLVASLYFLDYELPTVLSDAENKIPKDIPCIHLLLNWASGEEKWEGKGKSHVDVARRLRQLNHKEMADWLSKTVFYQLAVDINNTLNSYPFQVKAAKKPVTFKKFKNKDRNDVEDWTIYDSVLWTVMICVLASVIFAFYQLINLTCRRKDKLEDQEGELQDLLSTRTRLDSNEDLTNENLSECDYCDEDQETGSCRIEK